MKASNIDNSVFVNLTPHAVKIDVDGKFIEILPSGIVARAINFPVVPKIVQGVPVYNQVFKKIENLPTPKKGIYFIVSSIVKYASLQLELSGTMKQRNDLVVPTNLITNEDGVIACRSFNI